MALGVPDAARVGRHRPERVYGRGSARRVGARERRSSSSARTAVGAWKRCPQAEVRRLNNETHVHPRTPSVKSSVGKARQTRASAASECSPAEAERTVKLAIPGVRRVQRELCSARNHGVRNDRKAECPPGIGG